MFALEQDVVYRVCCYRQNNHQLPFCFQTMSPKEKGKFEDLAKQDKVRYEREMMSYVPARGGKKKKFKDPNAPKRPP